MGTDEYRIEQPAEGNSGETESTRIPHAFLDPGSWSKLTSTTSREAYVNTWLGLQCQLIDGVHLAVVAMGEPEQGPYTPIAHWPRDSEASFDMTVVAELAMSERKGSVRAGKSSNQHTSIAYPLLVDEQLCGVVALEITERDQRQLSQVMRQLQWGSAWLESLVRQTTLTSKSRLALALEMVAVSLESKKFQAAATAFVTEMTACMDCEWVGIGFLRGQHVQLSAFSHSAEFEEKNNLMRLIARAMDEALDQQALLVYPAIEEATPRALKAHEDLARQDNLGHVCTIPMGSEGDPIGSLTLARAKGQPFTEEELDFCRYVALLVGPVLDARRRDDRWIGSKLWDSVTDAMPLLVGGGHTGLKLIISSLLLLTLFLSVADGEYRVSADATLEGSIQRAITAKFTGYISHSNVRAGDVVTKDDLLFAMEDKDLKLERVKWNNQKEQRQREYLEALANGDRARMRILRAQKDQADSQIALIDSQLERTEVLAPFDGVIVSGDLSQMLGAPVERGEVLFELAPLNSYRVVLKVDEREYSQIEKGQSGALKLASMPNQLIDMVIVKKTPVAIAEDGRNYFRVEAYIDGNIEQLRPGMEGVGKVNIDRRKLIWIWTHELTEWVRFTFWSWWP
ncbi:HlyD family efflux transporter periplasmic adaptor subunit [Neptuniibacter halophilus]|uniref:HlyD family efflux transporter periplasmic adaptor subunit n=1 Tax=Neptuniibacter halophilus TaxID=651666 RepID=UPI002573B94B|nr:HlyD family efflux transporter periplasmic adaptor subunit [Neptuniibacter halophilus]